MIEKNALRFRKGDWLAIGVVLVVAAAVVLAFLPGHNAPAACAQVYLNGRLIKTVALGEPQSFVVEDLYSNEITVADGAIAFTSSDCPGQDCVHSGSIQSAGRSLVCLPNRVEIRVTAAADDVDFVVG